MEQDFLKTESSARMLSGLDAMAVGNWAEAVACFEAAADGRQRLSWREDPESAWMLAAAWINRGDAMRRSGNPDWRAESIVSFDKTIAAMGYVDLGKNPIFVERLILAWIHRGTACGEDGDVVGAVVGFSEAEKLLGEWGSGVTAERRFLAAMLAVNRARVSLATGEPLAAWEDVRRAIWVLKTLEMNESVSSAAITARSIQCRALALLLDEPGGIERVGDWIAEATDSAEEALALVRAAGFADPWVVDLVRYGARIYRICQPQFLGEFLTEWLAGDGPFAGDEDLKSEMRKVLLVAQVEAERKVLLAPHDTESVRRQTRILKSLQAGARALLGNQVSAH